MIAQKFRRRMAEGTISALHGYEATHAISTHMKVGQIDFNKDRASGTSSAHYVSKTVQSVH
jgi:hypothetical protein